VLLRRVISHFCRQEWTAIFLDFIIVVVGVFVGLQVDTWNVARRERAQEHEYLERLHADIQNTIAAQSERAGWGSARMEQQAIFLSDSLAPRILPKDGVTP